MVVSLTVQTSNIPFSETTGGVLVQFNGTMGLSPWFFLQSGFQQGSSNSFTFELENDIGLMSDVYFKIDSLDGWLLEKFDLYANFKSLTDIFVNKWLKIGDVEVIRVPRKSHYSFIFFFSLQLKYS